MESNEMDFNSHCFFGFGQQLLTDIATTAVEINQENWIQSSQTSCHAPFIGMAHLGSQHVTSIGVLKDFCAGAQYGSKDSKLADTLNSLQEKFVH